MAHDTNAITGTSTGTKCHIVALNNHFNKTNAMVSLMTSSASCDNKYATVTYIPKTNMPHICYISHICQLVQVHIWNNYVSIYISYGPTAINNVTRNMGTHNFTLVAYASEQICLPYHTYMSHCTTMWSTYRPHITGHTSLKNSKLKYLITMPLFFMCQQ